MSGRKVSRPRPEAMARLTGFVVDTLTYALDNQRTGQWPNVASLRPEEVTALWRALHVLQRVQREELEFFAPQPGEAERDTMGARIVEGLLGNPGGGSNEKREAPRPPWPGKLLRPLGDCGPGGGNSGGKPS